MLRRFFLELACIRLNQAAFFLGTLAPFLRASESPIAIACLRLVTLPPLPPLPEQSVPRFSRRIALFTLLPAALPYLAITHLLFFGPQDYKDEPLRLWLSSRYSARLRRSCKHA